MFSLFIQKSVFVLLALALVACSRTVEPDEGGEGGFPKRCADLFTSADVIQLEVEMADEEWAGMQQDCQSNTKRYRPITLWYRGESTPAMMRVKGNWSWSCDKMQFLISFNEVDKEGRFHGLRKIVLDAPFYDPTLLHERLAFSFQEDRGSLYSCVNHARLELNGEYYGLYVNVERIDREYLERHFDDPEGDLFKEGVFLKTNEATSNTERVDAFWATNDLSELEALVDVPQALDVWSGLAVLPDPDSYWAGVEINFYLYDHPSRGLLFLPYDSDIAFSEELWPGLAEADPITFEHPGWSKESQLQVILRDPAHCEQFVSAVATARLSFDPARLTARLDTWAAQIRPSLEEDPRRGFSMEDHDAELALMRTFLQRRAEFIDQWLAEGSHCPAAF